MDGRRDAWRWERRVLLAVIVILLAAEVAMRLGGGLLSGDVAHLQEIDQVVEYATPTGELGVLVWGNSLVGDGVDVGILEDELQRSLSGQARVGKVRPDGTTPLEWDYLLRRSAYLRGRFPHTVILGFGPGHLSDKDVRGVITRLAAHHVAREDISRLFREEIRDFEGRAAFLAARISRLLALQDRVQPRVLDLLIPGYTERAPLLLALPDPVPERGREFEDEADEVEMRERTATQSYQHFMRMVDDASGHGVRLILVPMPQPEGWQPFSEEEAIFRRCEITVLDIRDQVDLPEERYHDGLHLDPEGRRLFTEGLAPALAELLDFRDRDLIPGPCPS